eukprot:NODE_713_length_730_cov_713.418502_g647_i0.p1 GENE.NODE_713_length_730_cov_713.418502_g647_i0~~NODE_713_length_730_cov_713.418502_g647_i0.p1  ORF type:complete len:203 (+),score=67.38 NODE_713_length_730_cov_713.418502_g647_i0:49-609(+)
MADKITLEAPSDAETAKESVIVVKIGESAGTGPLNVSCKANLKPTLEIEDHQNKTMSIKFTPKATGPHEFTIKWGDDEVPGSPMKIDVGGEPLARDLSGITTTGDGLSGGKVNEPISFNVNVPDTAGEGGLEVEAAGPAEPKIELKDLGNRTFGFSMTVDKAGTYKVKLIWAGNDIPGSPFSLDVA